MCLTQLADMSKWQTLAFSYKYMEDSFNGRVQFTIFSS